MGCQCAMLCRPYFKELFLTRSSARSRLLLGVIQFDQWIFFSSPQPKIMYENSSLVVTADFHIKFSGDISRYSRYNCGGISRNSYSYASGLLYFQGMLIPEDDPYTRLMICNPITGQYAILPKLMRRCRQEKSFLGFDPIDKEYKVLFMAYPYSNEDHKILTLRPGKMRWRKIYCPLTHGRVCEGICINGVLYYLAHIIDKSSYDLGPYVIVCFNVRSEKFKFVGAKFCSWPMDITLINYKGKLGGIILNGASNYGGLSLCVWVLEDVEKQEWSKYVYSLWGENKVVKNAYDLSVAGMTTTGEIVLPMMCTSKPYNFYYFNPERNTLQSVEIQGFGEYLEALGIRYGVFGFVDYVEDPNANDQLRSNLNIIRKRPEPKCRAPPVKN